MKQQKKKNKTYTELSKLKTFDERLKYLKLNGDIGFETFGNDRIINQRFYRSKEWKNIRNMVIVRDGGCDLGIKECPINGNIYIHHINPIKMEDIENCSDVLLNPENLITTSFDTHNAIHYGNETNTFLEREKNDTCLWKNKEDNNVKKI